MSCSRFCSRVGGGCAVGAKALIGMKNNVSGVSRVMSMSKMMLIMEDGRAGWFHMEKLFP